MVETEECYLDPDALLVKYKPLMKSIYSKFSNYNGMFQSQSDFEDLYSQIQFEFVRLCKEYDPRRGVDFPGYIKIHLQQRVYHYITKVQRIQQKETVSYTRNTDDSDDDAVIDFDNCIELIDEDTVKAMEKVEATEALENLDWDEVLGKKHTKHRNLVESILYEKKTLEEIAAEEGVFVKTVKLRLYFVCRGLQEYYKHMEGSEIEGQSALYSVERKPIITRVSIMVRIPVISRFPIVTRQPIIV